MNFRFLPNVVPAQSLVPLLKGFNEEVLVAYYKQACTHVQHLSEVKRTALATISPNHSHRDFLHRVALLASERIHEAEKTMAEIQCHVNIRPQDIYTGDFYQGTPHVVDFTYYMHVNERLKERVEQVLPVFEIVMGTKVMALDVPDKTVLKFNRLVVDMSQKMKVDLFHDLWEALKAGYSNPFAWFQDKVVPVPYHEYLKSVEILESVDHDSE